MSLRLVLAMLLLTCIRLAWGEAPSSQQATAIILVATPQIKDSLFHESVVLVVRHGRSRPMGFILNKPLGQTAIEDKGAVLPAPFVGGPVSPREVINVFRQEGGGGSGLLTLDGDVHVGFGMALLNSLLKRKPVPPVRVFLGLSVWAHGQLENEIARGDWWLLPYDPELAFRTTDPEKIWQELAAKASRKDT